MQNREDGWVLTKNFSFFLKAEHAPSFKMGEGGARDVKSLEKIPLVRVKKLKI